MSDDSDYSFQATASESYSTSDTVLESYSTSDTVLESESYPTSGTVLETVPDENVFNSFEEQINAMCSEENDQKFEELLNDVSFDNEIAEQLLDYPDFTKKKLLIMKHKVENQLKEGKFSTPRSYITFLKTFSKSYPINILTILNCMESLRIALSNNPLAWVHTFGVKGLQTILIVLKLATKSGGDKYEKLQAECLKCILKYNKTEGPKEFLEQDFGHHLVAICIDYRKPSVMIPALQILTSVVHESNNDVNSNSEVLLALEKLGEMRKCERFLPIVEGITMTSNYKLWSACFQFINTLLSQTNDCEFRMHLRNEIVRNGLYDKLDILKHESTALVSKQFNFFESLKDEDADEIQSKFDNLRIEGSTIHDD